MPPALTQTRPLIHWPRERCQRGDEALACEWLETNGLGDYAASTVAFCGTRRYHGLLVARPPGNAKRHVFLARVEEHLCEPSAHGDAPPRWPLSSAAYPDVIAPAGRDHLEAFELRPFPTSRYAHGGIDVQREVLMVQGSQTVLVRYTVSGAGAGTELELEPMFACREADALTVENEVLDPSTEALPRAPSGFSFRPYAELPAVHLSLSAPDARLEPRPTWYKNLEYAADGARGYDCHEDQFAPALLRVPVGPAQEASGTPSVTIVLAATLGAPVHDPAALWASESSRREKALAGLPRDGSSDADSGTGQTLAAEAFLYRTPTGRTGVNAGYPWFVEWGRDTFIALPGLTLGLDHPERCLAALEGALPFLQDGLLPNVYGLGPEDSAYNSADAALWFGRAVRLYENATSDTQAVARTFLPALIEIAEAYRSGTRLGIEMDGEGLLFAGTSKLNATWMDAEVDGVPVTPRDGCPVEINALWYSLISHIELLVAAERSQKEAAPWKQLRLKVRRSFLERFWLPEEGRLADRWIPARGDEPGRADARVRPNMVIAAALELSPLTRAQRKSVVKVARTELLTPFGLRTLSRDDPDYQGVFGGDPAARDGAYHQGTVWPWLLGFFAEADLRGQGVNKQSLAAADALWRQLDAHQDEAGLNHLSEVFSGDPPHAPGGCFAQAWNTGEYLRIRAAVRKRSI